MRGGVCGLVLMAGVYALAAVTARLLGGVAAGEVLAGLAAASLLLAGMLRLRTGGWR